MKIRRILLVLIGVQSLTAAVAIPVDNYHPKMVLQWQSEHPTCFELGLPVEAQIESVPKFVVGGKMTEPQRIEGENLKTEHFEGIELSTGIPVVELVINKKGRVECVVSLRTTTPEFDKRLSKLISTWIFEPATVNENPICIRYILTLRIHYI